MGIILERLTKHWTVMSDSSPAAADANDYSVERSILDDIDEIIRIRRRRHNMDEQPEVTNAERKKIVATYKSLEKLQNVPKGRFLFEYTQGLSTLQKEVIIDFPIPSNPS